MNAQPRAIGGRLGWGLEFSYQHGLGSNMLQVDVGLPGFAEQGIHAVVVYDWLFPISSWKEAGEWNWYAGVGGTAGLYGFKESVGFIGVAGMIGVEYTFKFPLQLSLDYRPAIGPTFRKNDVGFGWHAYTLGLGIRYKF